MVSCKELEDRINKLEKRTSQKIDWNSVVTIVLLILVFIVTPVIFGYMFSTSINMIGNVGNCAIYAFLLMSSGWILGSFITQQIKAEERD